MSKIGRVPISIPSGVDITVDGGIVVAKGPKGSLSRSIPDDLEVFLGDKSKIAVKTSSKDPKIQVLLGTLRSHINNMVTGVSTGFERAIELHGIGYRVAQKGQNLTFSLGFTHPVNFEVPEGVTITIDGKANRVTFSGIDKEVLGQTVAQLRSIRPPEPYKGYGIRAVGEVVRRKQGKAGLAKEAK